MTTNFLGSVSNAGSVEEGSVYFENGQKGGVSTKNCMGSMAVSTVVVVLYSIGVLAGNSLSKSNFKDQNDFRQCLGIPTNYYDVLDRCT